MHRSFGSQVELQYDNRSIVAYVSAMKKCTWCFVSFSYSRFASNTRRLSMSLFHAITLFIIREKRVIGGSVALPYRKSRISAIVLVTASARYLRCCVVSYRPHWDVPPSSTPPSANDRGRKSCVWCLTMKKNLFETNAKAKWKGYLPGLGINVTLHLRRSSTPCSSSSSISSSSTSPVVDWLS